MRTRSSSPNATQEVSAESRARATRREHPELRAGATRGEYLQGAAQATRGEHPEPRAGASRDEYPQLRAGASRVAHPKPRSHAMRAGHSQLRAGASRAATPQLCSRTNPSHRSVIAACTMIALLCACPDDPPPTPPPPPPTLTLSELCSALATADCDRLSRCGLTGSPFDMERCLFRQATVRCEPLRAALQRAVDSGELTFFELAAATCRDHIANLDCTHNENTDWLAEPECRAIVGGNVAEGGACTFPFSCAAADNFCLATTECPGICQKLRTNNTPCTAREPCVEGFFCATPAMRCHARVALGAPCELSVAGNSCTESAFCDRSQPGDIRCAQARGRNTGCTSPYECAAGLVCRNSLCSGGFEGDTCNTEYDCNELLRCSNGRCTQPKATGESCMRTAECPEGHICAGAMDAMTCTVQPITGNDCSPTLPCYLGRCAGGVCQPAIADNETCAMTDECLPGRTCTDTKCVAPPISCVE